MIFDFFATTTASLHGLGVWKYGLLFVAAFAAGAINSVAGGGTLLTFPSLLMIVSPIVANATSTLALVPGSISAVWGYRKELRGARREVLLLTLPSLIGGAVGALWVVKTGDKQFARLIPWLIFTATALFLIQEPISRWMQAKRERESVPNQSGDSPDASGGDADLPHSWLRLLGLAAFQFLVAIYGGFFGAGIGIMMLAALGMMGLAANIHRANGVKNMLAACINGIAAATFIYKREIDWSIAGMMAVAAIAGGYGGAGFARQLGQKTVRKIVVGIGIGIGVAILVWKH